MESRPFRRNQSGFTLIELMLSSVIVTMSVLTFATFSHNTGQFDRNFQTRSNLLEVKAQILNNLHSIPTWAKNVNAANTTHPSNSEIFINPELSCIRDGTACTPGEHDLTLLSQDGNVFLDMTNATGGFTRNGVPCNTFGTAGAGSGDSACLYRFRVSWEPICPSVGACLKPQIKINVRMDSNDANTSANLTALQTEVDFLLDQPLTVPPAAKKVSKYTNSTLYFAAESPLVINPIPFVVSQNPVYLPSFTPFTTVNGGTVSYVDPSNLRYTPGDRYYGLDFFTYKIRETVTQKEATGVAMVYVMTPYTWTGLSDGKASDQKNFCGKAINGICDGQTFPSGHHNIHMVFNDTCSNCNPILDDNSGWTGGNGAGGNFGAAGRFNAATLEVANSFPGNVRLTASASIGTYAWSSWPWERPFTLAIRAGTFDASAAGRVNIIGMRNGLAYRAPYQEDFSFVMENNARFISPATLVIGGATKIPDASMFVHNNGTVVLGSNWARNNTFFAPNTRFYNLSIHSADPTIAYGGFGIELASDLAVDNNVTIASGNADQTLMNGRHPSTGNFVTPAPTIRVAGSVHFEGTGGGHHCNDGGVGSCLGPYLELVGMNNQEIRGKAIADLSTLKWSPEIVSAPSIRINKTAGNVTMRNVVGIRRDFEVASIGTGSLDFTNSQLVFNATDCGVARLTATGVEFHDLYFMRYSCSGQLDLGDSNVIVKNNFHFYPASSSAMFGSSLKSAKINLYGDLYYDGFPSHGGLGKASEVVFVGTGNQTIRGTAAKTGALGVHLRSQKPSGNLYLDGVVGTYADLLIDSGNLIANSGSIFWTAPHGANYFKSVLKAPGTVFENVHVNHALDLASDIQTKNLMVGTHPDDPYGRYGSYTTYSSLTTNSYNMSVSGDLKLYEIGITTTGIKNVTLTGDSVQRFEFGPEVAKGLNFDTYKLDVNKSGGRVVFGQRGRLDLLCVRGSGTFEMESDSMLQVDGLKDDAAPLIRNGATLVTGSDPLPWCT